MEITGITYTNKDFSEQPLAKAMYDGCNFLHCNFEGAVLSNVEFQDCRFTECNLSNAKVNRTAFRNVHFRECKMLGLRFDTCNDWLLSVGFDACQLDLCSFYKLKLKQTVFNEVSLTEADFTEADLSSVKFSNCNLHLATFDRTILVKADFRTAYNYALDPELNFIKKARFSKEGVAGLLAKYEILVE